MKDTQISTNGVKLHLVQDGSADGELVILLHGFPDFWYGWRRQIQALAEAGFKVWAPDQRGCNLSEKPKGLGAYSIDQLAADVVGLIDAAGVEKAYIAGHDWGAAVAWWTAQNYPDRIAKMVAMNVPHPGVMQAHLRKNFAQLLKSWYIFFFQLPWLPEAASRRNNWKMASSALVGSSQPGTFSTADLEKYREAWSQPGAYRAMVNWYRAMVQRPPASGIRNPRIHVPTLLIWGAQDRFLSREMAQPSIDLCDDGRLVFFEEASHWVQHEEADGVNQLLLEFLGSGV